MNDLTFYPASAYRRECDHSDIIPGFQFDSYEAAARFASQYGHDSDDQVLTYVDGAWVKVWRRDNVGNLMVSDEHDGASKAIPLWKFLERRNSK